MRPTGVPTPMITDDVTQAHLRASPATTNRQGDLLPLPVVAVSDVCDPVVHLAAADPDRAVTRVTLPVDGGSGAR